MWWSWMSIEIPQKGFNIHIHKFQLGFKNALCSASIKFWDKNNL